MASEEQQKLQADLEYVRRVRADMDRMANALEQYIQWHRDHPEAAATFKMFLHEPEKPA